MAKAMGLLSQEVMNGYDLQKEILIDFFKKGINVGARYVVVVYDSLRQEEYPIFIFPEQDVKMEIIKHINSKDIFLKAVFDLFEDAYRQIEAVVIPEITVISRVKN